MPDVGCVLLHTDRIHDRFVPPAEYGARTTFEVHVNSTARELPTSPLNPKFFCSVRDFDAAENHVVTPVTKRTVLADAASAVLRHYTNLFAPRNNNFGAHVRPVKIAWAREYGRRVDSILHAALQLV